MRSQKVNPVIKQSHRFASNPSSNFINNTLPHQRGLLVGPSMTDVGCSVHFYFFGPDVALPYFFLFILLCFVRSVDCYLSLICDKSQNLLIGDTRATNSVYRCMAQNRHRKFPFGWLNAYDNTSVSCFNTYKFARIFVECYFTCFTTYMLSKTEIEK